MRTNNNKFIVMIVFIGLIAMIWFKGNFLVASGDFSFPPDRILEFYRTIYSWDHSSLGSANFRVLGASLPWGIFLLLTKLIGLSLVASEKLWLYLLFTSMGLSMYFLVITIVKEKFRYWAGFCAALLFMFNPWSAVTFTMIWQYVVFLPLILGLYIKGLNENRGIKYILILCFMWMITCNSGLINIRAALNQWMFLLMYLVFYLITNFGKNKNKAALIFTGKLFLFWIVLNAYWLLPFIVNISTTIESTAFVYQSINFTWLDAYHLNSSGLIDAFRLMGFWGIESSYKGYPYFYWTPVFKTSLFILIGFILPLVAFSSLLLLHKIKRSGQNLVFFVLVGVLGLFVMNGVYGSYGKLNLFFVQYLPYFAVFFSIPYFFGGIFVVISYSILVGVVIAWLWNCYITGRLCNYRKILSVILAFLLIGVYGWPMWSGEFLYPGNEVLAGAQYTIPENYYKARRWLREQPNDFRIFALPYSKLGYMSYSWPPKGFSGPDPTANVLARDIITGFGIGKELVGSWNVSNSSEFSSLLGLMNVKYLLFHDDANWKFIKDNSWYINPAEDIKFILESQSGIFLEKIFGKIDFYKISDEYFLPHIYASTYD